MTNTENIKYIFKMNVTSQRQQPDGVVRPSTGHRNQAIWLLPQK